MRSTVDVFFIYHEENSIHFILFNRVVIEVMYFQRALFLYRPAKHVTLAHHYFVIHLSIEV